uniref:Uncharacterized protein n=1 Tax=Hyaloperonospora arabidopsidis (strain Emoy2) TaxID=559515 RepID=M4BWS1_HYAAE
MKRDLLSWLTSHKAAPNLHPRAAECWTRGRGRSDCNESVGIDYPSNRTGCRLEAQVKGALSSRKCAS